MLPKIKNILYIESGFSFGGAVVCLAELIKKLNKDKYVPISIFSQRDEITKNLMCQTKTPFLIIKRYRRSDHANILLNRLPDFIKKIFVIPIVLLEIFLGIPFLVKVVHTVKKQKVDIVHINNCFWANTEVILLMQLLKIPCIAQIR
ncbi:unnamed protein product, partial [marine sediment metagenome]